jgi:lambda family phage portal protein
MGAFARLRAAGQTIAARTRAAGAILASGALYQSAGSGYRVRGWHAPMTGPTATIIQAGDTLRNKSRAEVRNNAWARNIVDLLVANLVGTGFTPKSNFGIDDTARNAEISAAWRRDAGKRWKRWAATANADGGNFHGLLATAVRGMVEAGDSFVVRVAGESAGVPMQLRVLEAEMVPLWKNETLAGGAYIQAGIEFDRNGVVRAYHMYRQHPGEFSLARPRVTVDLERIPARNVLHFFRRLRPGQVRGEPWLAPVLLPLFDLRGYFDAEAYRKKCASNFVFKVEVPDVAKASDAIGELHDASAADGVVDTKPGSTFVGGPGEVFDIVAPADVGPNFTPFVVARLREICAGVGVPYGLGTGDMSQEVYTSHRAARLTFEARMDMLQCADIVPHLDVVWAWWLDEEVTAGTLLAPRYAPWRDDYLDLDWTPPKRDWIDPEKETNAKESELLTLQITSRTRICAQRGENFEEIARELAQEQRVMRDLGIEVDPAALTQRKSVRPAQPPTTEQRPPARTGTDG